MSAQADLLNQSLIVITINKALMEDRGRIIPFPERAENKG
jgi:hypothetical protein